MITTEPDVVVWHGCYDARWNELIVPDAFAHPAKMARGLVARIFSELIAGGWLRPGDVVVDPFGGIGTTAIEGASRGVQVVCCELEPKFVALALDNFALHRRDWQAMRRPLPIIVNGDSRELRRHVGPALAACVVSSPPFAGCDTRPTAMGAGKATRADGDGAGRNKGDYIYGESDGQLGTMAEGNVAAVISSPPYAEIASGAGGLNTKAPKHAGQQGGRSASSASQDTDQRYGESDGQLARMALGDVDALVSSPPYEESVNAKGHGIDWSKADPKATGNRRRGDDCKHGQTLRDQLAYGDTPGQIGAMRGGTVAAVVSSPPFLDARSDTTASVKGNLPTAHDPEAMGVSIGNLQTLRSGDIAAIVSSPPYEGSQVGTGKDGRSGWRGYTDIGGGVPGAERGQLSAMPAGDGVDAIVSSPPFTQGYSGGGGINVKGYGADGADKVGSRTYQGTGNERVDGNLETLTLGDVAAVVTSPPYEGSLSASRDGIDWEAARRAGAGGGEHQAPGASVAAAYPVSDANIGNATGDTFWSAAKQIVAESFAVLRPGGTAVWVVKAFVRDKKLVDFPGDWRKLCEHVGFETFLEVHASLVHEEVRSHLFDGEVVKRRERKSFFRRLAEKKGSPRIDFEVVLFMRKPV